MSSIRDEGGLIFFCVGGRNTVVDLVCQTTKLHRVVVFYIALAPDVHSHI